MDERKELNMEYRKLFKSKIGSENEFMQSVINRETLQDRRLQNYQRYNRLWNRF